MELLTTLAGPLLLFLSLLFLALAIFFSAFEVEVKVSKAGKKDKSSITVEKLH